MGKYNSGVIIALALLFTAGNARFTYGQINDGYSFSMLSDPLGVFGTLPEAISMGTVVGSYSGEMNNIGESPQGFIYNGSAFTTIDDPNASSTLPMSISGNTIVGSYRDNVTGAGHGFLYNGATFATLNDPSGTDTAANGVSGNNIVGTYTDSNFITQGFMYNGSTYTTLHDPSAATEGGTYVTAVSGNDIVGYFGPVSGPDEGFLYNGTAWTTFADPLSVSGTFVTGISGNTIVGYYDAGETNYHGFIYNGSTFTTVDDPLATGLTGPLPNRTQILGISENGTLVGTFDGLTANGGFIATPVVPEPASCALLAGAGFLLLHRRRSRRWV